MVAVLLEVHAFVLIALERVVMKLCDCTHMCVEKSGIHGHRSSELLVL